MRDAGLDVGMAIRREAARLEALREDASRLRERLRGVNAEILRIEQLLGLRHEKVWRNKDTDPLWTVAYDVLAKAGKPLHIREMTRLVNQKRGRLRQAEVYKAKVDAAIRAKPATFVLLYRYTWGLREWAKDNEPQADPSA